MFQDVGVSKDLNEHFRKHLAHSNDSLDSKLKYLLVLSEKFVVTKRFSLCTRLKLVFRFLTETFFSL